jgi:hypothetical protein
MLCRSYGAWLCPFENLGYKYSAPPELAHVSLQAHSTENREEPRAASQSGADLPSFGEKAGFGADAPIPAPPAPLRYPSHIPPYTHRR